MATLNELLDALRARGAYSLQLRSGMPPALLIDRDLEPLPEPPLARPVIEALIAQLHAGDGGPGQSGAGVHVTPDGGRFEYRIRDLSGGPAVAFRPLRDDAAAPARAPAPPPEPAPAADGEAGGLARGEPAASEPPWPCATIFDLLEAVFVRRASDLVVSAGTAAVVRVAGSYRPVERAVFTDDEILQALAGVLTPARRHRLDESGSADAAFELPGEPRRRFRVNVFRQFDGLAAAFRPIWDTVPTFEELNLPPSLVEVGAFPQGLVLVTGPTGSGKSTTLASLVEHINAHRACHIVTLEDPIEYRFGRKRSLIHQREIGLHVDSFATGLRAALREAPDIILVGEMRDRDTIASALTAAETGHLVLSTLHTGSPAQAVDRIIDVFPEHQQIQVRIQLADVLRAIVAQRLLPTRAGGRMPVVELVRVNFAFANLIRERKTHMFSSHLQAQGGEDMILFDASLARLVEAGHIDREVALRAARDPKHLKAMLDASDARASGPAT